METMIIDLRTAEAFRRGHIPRSIFTGLTDSLPSLVSAIGLPVGKMMLVAEDEESASFAKKKLLTLDIKDVDIVVDLPLVLEQLSQVTLREAESNPLFQIIDVRGGAEWAHGAIFLALHAPLDTFFRAIPESLKEIHESGHSLALMCRSGYRSTIGASLLKRAGFSRIFTIEQ